MLVTRLMTLALAGPLLRTRPVLVRHAPLAALASRAPSPGKAKRPPKAKQSLGQNFLQDESIARRIAGALEHGSEGGRRVVELGPGQGAITRHLSPLYPELTAVEIDERMIEVLADECPDVAVVHADLLKLDLGALAAEKGGTLGLISNTPFYLTSPLLFKVLGSLDHVDTAVLTTQLEVAQKVLAPPSTKQYGILAVMLQLFASPAHLFDIPPEAFSPAPAVTSSVLRLTPSATARGGDRPTTAAEREGLLALLKLGFEQRRKMLRVTLKPILAAGVATTPPDNLLAMRPEQLRPEEWLDLSLSLFGEGDDGCAAVEAAVGTKWKGHKAGWK